MLMHTGKAFHMWHLPWKPLIDHNWVLECLVFYQKIVQQWNINIWKNVPLVNTMTIMYTATAFKTKTQHNKYQVLKMNPAKRCVFRDGWKAFVIEVGCSVSMCLPALSDRYFQRVLVCVCVCRLTMSTWQRDVNVISPVIVSWDLRTGNDRTCGGTSVRRPRVQSIYKHQFVWFIISGICRSLVKRIHRWEIQEDILVKYC